MGCFNANGFLSKLPLLGGDDMVLIFCADRTRVAAADSLPIYVAEKYVPLNAPIFCSYNDYGSVFEKDIVRDANVDFFEKSIGVSCEELCNMIHDFGSISLEEIKEIKELRKEEEDEYSARRLKRLDEFERILNVLLPEGISYDKWREKTGLTFIMEHRDVYENISKIAEGPICNDWMDDTNIVAKRCEKSFNIIKEYPEFDEYFNLLNLEETVDIISDGYLCKMVSSKDANKKEEMRMKYKEVRNKYEEHKSFFASSCILEGGYLDDAFPTYRDIKGSKEWEKLSKHFVDFFRFTRVMFSIHRVFELSTYASQSVYTKPLLKVNEIINNKAQAICKNYEEERS